MIHARRRRERYSYVRARRRHPTTCRTFDQARAYDYTPERATRSNILRRTNQPGFTLRLQEVLATRKTHRRCGACFRCRQARPLNCFPKLRYSVICLGRPSSFNLTFLNASMEALLGRRVAVTLALLPSTTQSRSRSIDTSGFPGFHK